MYCHKCGNQALEDSAFCEKCGVKLVGNDSYAQTPANPVIPTVPMNAHHAPPKTQIYSVEPKKKNKKKFVVVIISIVSIAVLLALIGLIVLMNGNKGGTTKAASKSDVSSIQASASSSSVSLSESYTNEAEGFSFKYPSAWAVVTEDKLLDFYDESELKDVVVLLANEQVDRKVNSYIEILKFPDSEYEIEDIFFSTQSEFTSSFDDTASIIEMFDADLNGTTARMIIYTTTEEVYYRTYFYCIGSNLYRINFLCQAAYAESIKPFFVSIMESYTITQPKDAASANNSNAGEILYNSYPVAQFFNDVVIEDVLGEPLGVEEFTTGYKLNYDDISFLIRPVGIYSIACHNPSEFKVDGLTLDTDRAGLINTLGYPSIEGWNEWNEELYEVIYRYENYKINFSFDSPEGKINSFFLNPIIEWDE